MLKRAFKQGFYSLFLTFKQLFDIFFFIIPLRKIRQVKT